MRRRATPAPDLAAGLVPERCVRASRSRRRGFTLIEVIIVLAMLVMVLVACYSIFINILDTERAVVRITVPPKVGEAINSLIRRDLAGTFFKGSVERLDRQVFQGIDSDGSDGPQDRLTFLSTVDPTPRADLDEWESIRSITVVSYFLEPNEANDDYPTYTLYRKETTEFSGGNVLDAPGINYVVYDKVRSLNFQYYDGYDWFDEWYSDRRILEEQAYAEEEALRREEEASGIDRVSEEENVEFEETWELPAAAIPTAVRIQLEVYASVGREIFEKNGEPDIRFFSSVVPLLAAQRIKLEIETPEDAVAGGGMAGDDPTLDTFGAGGGAGGGRDGRGGPGRGDRRGAGGRRGPATDRGFAPGTGSGRGRGAAGAAARGAAGRAAAGAGGRAAAQALQGAGGGGARR